LYTAVANARHIRSRSRACQANPANPPSRGAASSLPTKPLQSTAISAERWDRRRGCRAEGSPACCRRRVSVPAFAGLRPRADTTRHRTLPVCRQAARGLALSCPAAPWCQVAARTASARNRWRAPAAQFAPAGPLQLPRRRPPSARRKKSVNVSFACGETASGPGGSAGNSRLQDLR